MIHVEKSEIQTIAQLIRRRASGVITSTHSGERAFLCQPGALVLFPERGDRALCTALQATFALGMTVVLGVKPPLNLSVFRAVCEVFYWRILRSFPSV